MWLSNNNIRQQGQLVGPPIFPKALGNRVPSRWESYSQPLGIVFPALGNRVPSPWESCSQPLGIMFPALGIVFPALGNRVPSRWDRSASRGHSKCQPRVLEVPAAGNRSASRWQSNCRPLAIGLPRGLAKSLSSIAVRKTIVICCIPGSHSETRPSCSAEDG